MEELDISQVHLADINSTELLRSRINQQSDLICILKKRADEYLVKYTKREEEFVELNKKYEQLSNLYKEEQRRGSALENTYFTLGKTHQELVQTHRCTVSEVEKLRLDIQKLNGDVVDLQKSNNELIDNCKRKDVEMASYRESVATKESMKEAEVKALKLREVELIEQLNTREASFNTSISSKENQLRAEIENVKEQLATTNSLLLEANVKVKAFQNDEQKRMEELAKVNALYALEKKRCVDLEEKVRRKGDRAIAEENEHLHQTIVEMEEKHNDAINKFEVYKKYAEEVLDKEKCLNSKLRKLRSVEKISRSDSAPSIGKVTMK